DFWWGAALLYLARIPHRIGYSIQPGTPFLTSALPFPQPEHATLSNLRLASAALQALGYPPLTEPYTPARYPLSFTPTPEEHAWVAQQLQQANIDAQTPIIVIHAGTGGAVKLWRTEAWAHIANTLHNLPPTHIVLTGSNNEHLMLEEIARHMTTPPLLLTSTTVGQLAALLHRATLILGVDNGPLHLAITQNRPTLRLYGPTDSRIFGPWGAPEQHIVITATQRCATCPAIPCGRLDWDPKELPAHPCVRLITEQKVEEAVASLLPPPSAPSATSHVASR
ncbi:MAG TPA: glycosyltransferase family 9 protein, partial [Ktedonosporobacter sp.]|nr:glycosyltransferase family 9 protein [Ktedonosporobacter sp.]